MFDATASHYMFWLTTTQNLRSADEMEEEERAAQSAKLQELIRRGTPQDLQEANRMMKIMAGYDTRNKTNYRAKAAEEVSRVQQKARLLEEMLQGYKPGDEIKEGDVYAVRLLAQYIPLAILTRTTGARKRAPKCASQDPEDV